MEQGIIVTVLCIASGLLGYWWGYCKGVDESIDQESSEELTRVLGEVKKKLDDYKKK